MPAILFAGGDAIQKDVEDAIAAVGRGEISSLDVLRAVEREADADIAVAHDSTPEAGERRRVGGGALGLRNARAFGQPRDLHAGEVGEDALALRARQGAAGGVGAHAAPIQAGGAGHAGAPLRLNAAPQRKDGEVLGPEVEFEAQVGLGSRRRCSHGAEAREPDERAHRCGRVGLGGAGIGRRDRSGVVLRFIVVIPNFAGGQEARQRL